MITVEAGALEYVIAATGEATRLDPDTPGIVEPEVRHRVAPLGAVRFSVEFYR